MLSDGARNKHIEGEIRMEDDQLNKMLQTLMGEAKQIRGDGSQSSRSSSMSSVS